MQGVLGAFRELDSAVHAIEDLKKERVGVTDNQVLVQYIFSLGAHGAHTF